MEIDTQEDRSVVIRMTQITSTINTTEEYLYITNSNPGNQQPEEALNISLAPNFSLPSQLTENITNTYPQKGKSYNRNKPSNTDPP